MNDVEDPRQALFALASQARGMAELDRLLGIPCSPVPILPPLQIAPSAPSAPAVEPPARPAPAAADEPEPAIAAVTDDLAARRRDNESRLEALANRMAGCQRCPLHEGRTRLVFGQGDAAAEVALVGEGPGYHEDQQGLAFVGRSGELLTKMISAMGLSRDDVFIANVVKCRPAGNRAPHPNEMGTCLPYLREQLDIIRPNVICAMGKTAALGLGLIGPNDSLGRNRGRFRDWNGIPTMITYHPAYLLRQPSEKAKTWRDLQQLFPHIERRKST